MNNPKPLAGQVILITGGTRGIGRAIAWRLLADGAAVAICGRGKEAVDAVVRELQTEPGGKVVGKAADVTKHEQVQDLFRFVDARHGSPVPFLKLVSFEARAACYVRPPFLSMLRAEAPAALIWRPFTNQPTPARSRKTTPYRDKPTRPPNA